MRTVAPKPLPSIERLNELFELDRETGVLTWKARTTETGFYTDRYCRTFNTANAGKLAGNVTAAGYRIVKLRLATGGKLQTYTAHRIIWKMVNGRDPFPLVDHIDRDPSNNRPSNLREADYQLNVMNTDRNHSRRRNGSLGAYAAKNGKFKSQIYVKGKAVHLGTFATKDEAHAAFVAARDKRDRQAASAA